MNQVDNQVYRVATIDRVRGLAIIIMAIDHVRDYFYYASASVDPMGSSGIDWDLFLTRFVTHFCAPVFVFLAGTSAGLMALRKNSHQLGLFLVKRGLWLIFVEIVIVSTGWTFSPFGVAELGGSLLIIMQVIWVIGASMIILGGLQYLPVNIVLGLGIVILVGHNSLDTFWPVPGGGGMNEAPLWVALHAQSSVVSDNVHILFYYPLLPWIGVMALGFGCARVFCLDDFKLRQVLLTTGFTMMALFFLLRSFNGYGDPSSWISVSNNLSQTIMNYMNVNKYPPSLMYLCITLGPAFILLGYAGSWNGKIGEILVTFGRVPFLFYVVHIYLIHFISAGVGIFQGYDASKMLSDFTLYPDNWGYGLPVVYLVWLFILILLYPLCRWFMLVKKSRKDWWLSYL